VVRAILLVLGRKGVVCSESRPLPTHKKGETLRGTLKGRTRNQLTPAASNNLQRRNEKDRKGGEKRVSGNPGKGADLLGEMAIVER